MNKTKCLETLFNVVLFAVLSYSVTASEYNPYYWERVEKSHYTPGSVGFGDLYDPASGQLTFRVVDASIPGNFDIPVEFARSFDTTKITSLYKRSVHQDFGGQQRIRDVYFYSNAEQDNNLGYWFIDVPYTQTTSRRSLQDVPTLSVQGRVMKECCPPFESL